LLLIKHIEKGVSKGSSLSVFIYLTLPPAPSLKVKGRGVTNYNINTYPLPLLLKGRVGDGLRNSKNKRIYNF
jgi:hypothetical protein